MPRISALCLSWLFLPAACGARTGFDTAGLDNHYAGNGSSGTSTANATRLALGMAHACAIESGGTVKCWGDNQFGQLGNGTTSSSSTAVQVQGLTNAVELGAAGEATCARL
jgi:alpha-tubulin suppressor-like RCC1 family protein